MDIQRKAFESSNNVNPDWSFKFDEELQQYVATDFEMTNQVDEFNEHWDTFRAGWQAAKAQADQKVKLLLCDEHLKKCESPTGIFNSQYPDEEPCLICLAKEAKAQAVPEGFVLVKKELPKQIAEKMAIDRIDKPRHENDPVWSEIAEQSYKDQVKSKKWEFWRDYKAMIEAQEPTND